MKRGLAYLAAAAGAAGALWAWTSYSPAPKLEAQLALVERYCTECHNDAERAGDVSFDHLSAANALGDAALWERMVRKVRAGAMPPQDGGTPLPDGQAEWLVTSTEEALDRAFARETHHAAPVIHRLNRAEYANAIRDLLGVSVDASLYLPPDNVVAGFDNIAEALTVSPALLAGYLSASAEVADLAVGNPARRSTTVTYRTKPDGSQHEHVEGAPLGTIGGLAVEHFFPVDGVYRFEPRLYRQILASVRGLEFPNTLIVTIDKERVHSADFGGHDDQKRSNEENAYAVAEEIDARLAFERHVTAGPHQLAVTFLRKPPAQSADVWKEYRRQLIDSNEDKGLPHLDQVDVSGPLTVTGVGSTPSRRAILACSVAIEADEALCASEILTRLARQAYRRPVEEHELAELERFFARGRAEGSFDRGIAMAIRRMISGAEFVFRAELPPPQLPPGTPYRITDLELASRLSFFLWSSLPDAALLEAAVSSTLADAEKLDAQVHRMLRDDKSAALIDNFVGQWLALRNLEGITPDPAAFPDFDDNLRRALVRETELLFATVVREDRSVLDVLDADYTFVNERLARHYGIPGIYGERFERIAVTDPARRGILGHGSFLTLTSVATRTSPVTRGKWILDNLLGLPPGNPPPEVPAIEASAAAKPETLREQMTRHRSDPVCAGCHEIMDPFGFALESFDAVGRWRSMDSGLPIDSRSTLFDGSSVAGVVELREFLLGKRELFVRNLTEKLMTYALGRNLEPSDMPAVRQIVRAAARDNYRFSSLVTGIVASAPFQLRTSPPAPAPLYASEEG